MDFGEILTACIPYIIPVFLLASWIYGAPTSTKKSGDGKSHTKKDEVVSDKDMTE